MTFYRSGVSFSPESGNIPEGELIDVNPNAMPFLSSILYANRTRAMDKELAYDYVGQQIMLFVNPASRRLIIELRQARGALVGSETVPVDPAVTPEYPGVSMREILYNDTSGLEGVNEKLQAIIDSSVDDVSIEETIENIRLIALILGAIA